MNDRSNVDAGRRRLKLDDAISARGRAGDHGDRGSSRGGRDEVAVEREQHQQHQQQQQQRQHGGSSLSPHRLESWERGLNTVQRGTGGHPLAGILTPRNEAPKQRRREREPQPYQIEPERGGMMRQDETQGCLAFVPQAKRGVFQSFPPFIEVRCRVDDDAQGHTAKSLTMRFPVHFVDEEAWGVSPASSSPRSEGPFVRSLLAVIRRRVGLGFWEPVELECRGVSLLGRAGMDALQSHEVDAHIRISRGVSVSRAMSHMEDSPGGKYSWLKKCRLVPPCDGSSARATFDSVEVGRPIYVRAVRCQRPGDASLVQECTWLSCDLHSHILPAICTAGSCLVFYSSDTTSAPAPDFLVRVHPGADGSRRTYFTIMLHVALALEHLHRQGHVHLNVCPSNVMVRSTGGPGEDQSGKIRCELCDWGLSSTTAARHVQIRRGTPGYWSPEQVVDLCPCGCEMEDGRPLDPYWRSSKVWNPPIPTKNSITASADSWGWATTLLGIMGQLQRMRTDGYAEFMSEFGEEQEVERVVSRCLDMDPLQRPCMTTVVRVVGGYIGGEHTRVRGHDLKDSMIKGGGVGALGHGWGDSNALVAAGVSSKARSAEEDAVAAAGRAILRNVVGHGGGEGSWVAEKRMVRCMSAKGQLERAEEACANALEDLVENRAGLLAVGEAQLELAGVLLRLCKYEECLDGLQRAAELLGQHGGNDLDRARALLNMGVALERLGQLDVALMRFEQGFELRRVALQGPHLLTAGALVSVAGAMQRLGRTRQALDEYLEAESMLIKCLGPDELLVGEVHVCIGGVHADRLEHSLALSRYFDALALFSKAGAGPLTLSAQHRRIGEVYRRQGQLKKALAHFSGALDVRSRLLGERYSGMCNMDVAGVHFQMGEFDLALTHYQRALECHSLAANNGTVNGEIVDVAHALGSMALVYEKKRDWHRSWELCARALDRGRLRRGKREGGAAEGDKRILELQQRLQARKTVWGKVNGGSSDWTPLWVPDKEASQCKLCLAYFGLFLRRHHCRSCGHVVCDGCSGNRPRGKRVCDSCCFDGDKTVLWEEDVDEDAARGRGDSSAWAQSVPFKVPDFTAENKGL